MSTEQEKTVAPAPVVAPATTGAPAGARPAPRSFGGRPQRRGGNRGAPGAGGPGGGRGGDRGGRPQRGGGRERTRSEFDNKIIDIRRVARVTSGGRRFSFSVAIVVGDKKGSVGVGLGKGSDTALAIDKATKHGKKNMITVPLTATSSIAHDVEAKVGPSRIMLRPATGRGLVAGSAARTVLELAGVRDVSARILSRSKNKLNNARATVAALKMLKSGVKKHRKGEAKPAVAAEPSVEVK